MSLTFPLLGNVYLHYVLDLWVEQWRKRYARGDVVIIRHADDFAMGFQHRGEAERFLADLRRRFHRFGLSLHPDKTRLIEFGRFAASNRRQRGQGKPESFDFLGFTHSCATTRKDGWFTIRRQMSSLPSKNCWVGTSCGSGWDARDSISRFLLSVSMFSVSLWSMSVPAAPILPSATAVVQQPVEEAIGVVNHMASTGVPVFCGTLVLVRLAGVPLESWEYTRR